MLTYAKQISGILGFRVRVGGILMYTYNSVLLLLLYISITILTLIFMISGILERLNCFNFLLLMSIDCMNMERRTNSFSQELQ